MRLAQYSHWASPPDPTDLTKTNRDQEVPRSDPDERLPDFVVKPEMVSTKAMTISSPASLLAGVRSEELTIESIQCLALWSNLATPH